jgi:translocator protein
MLQWLTLKNLPGLVLWLMLCFAVAATTIAFWRVRPLAGAQPPYLLWVSIAVALNHAVWQRNPQLLG